MGLEWKESWGGVKVTKEGKSAELDKVFLNTHFKVLVRKDPNQSDEDLQWYYFKRNEGSLEGFEKWKAEEEEKGHQVILLDNCPFENPTIERGNSNMEKIAKDVNLDLTALIEFMGMLSGEAEAEINEDNMDALMEDPLVINMVLSFTQSMCTIAGRFLTEGRIIDLVEESGLGIDAYKKFFTEGKSYE